jgi:hypothetical protein
VRKRPPLVRALDLAVRAVEAAAGPGQTRTDDHVEDLFLASCLALLAPFLGEAGSATEVLSEFAISFGFILGLFLLARPPPRRRAPGDPLARAGEEWRYCYDDEVLAPGAGVPPRPADCPPA